MREREREKERNAYIPTKDKSEKHMDRWTERRR
jgi:hypothetical protein